MNRNLKIKGIVSIIFLMVSIGGFAQSKLVWLKQADEYFTKGDFASALKFYQLTLNDSFALNKHILPYEVIVSNQKLKGQQKSIDSLTKVPTKTYIHHQIATCYQKTYDYKRAAEHLKQSSQTKYFPNDAYFLGEALMNIKEYQQAKDVFTAYSQNKSHPDSLVVKAIQKIIACNYALVDGHFKTEVIVTKADSVFNGGTSSFGTRYFDDENRLTFTSAREGGVILDPKEQNSSFLCDIYWTQRKEDTVWEAAHNFGRPLNSAQNDAAAAFNKSDVVFFNRWNDENPKEKPMYLARMLNFKFFDAYKLGEKINYPNSINIQPYITPDNHTLFFSSNRPGGLGGMDIWKVKIDDKGNITGEPVNLGAPINSQFDEESPFFHAASNMLFFSSNGHNSLGGLDLFKSSFNPNTASYGKPVNLGEPINSSQDDSYLIWDTKLKHGFFSSDREPCEYGHCYHIYRVKNAPIHIYLEGYAYDFSTNKILPNTKLTFKPVHGKFKSFVLQTDAKGHYSIELQQQWETFIKAQKKDYFADAATINTKSITETTTLHHDFYLRPVPKEEIDIPGIEYDFNKATLRERSKRVLDTLYKLIKLNDNMVIQLNAHTDQRGSASYNLKLSQERAQSCVDYLVKKGIEKSRLIAVGHGETQPAYLKSENGEPVLDKEGKRIYLMEEYIKSFKSVKKRDELYQRNRRTTFKVVKQ